MRFLGRVMCTTCGRKSTLMTQADPELRCCPISTIQMDGNPPSFQVITSPFPQVLLARRAKNITGPLLLVGQSSNVVCLGAMELVSPLWWNMGTTLGSSQPRAGFERRRSASLSVSLPASEVKRMRNSSQAASPAMSRHSSRVSESDSPCEQSAVGVQSVRLVNEGKLTDASGPCAPSKSNLSVEAAGSCGTKLSSEEARALSKLHESIPVPSAIHWWVLWKRYTSRGTSASHAAFDTRVSCTLRHVQPAVFSGVELVSRATNISRKGRNWETIQRQSKAYKRAEREAKRKLLAQPRSL